MGPRLVEDTLGDRIRAVRRARLNARGRPTTLAEFGELIAAAERTGGAGDVAPYPHSTVSRWETNQRRPSEQTLAAIAAVARVSVTDLVHGWRPTERRPRAVLSDKMPPPTPGIGMTRRLTVWRQAFLLQLAQAGATDEDLEAVGGWLARPVWARAGGSPVLGLSDDEVLDLWARMAEVARWCLARRGRGVRVEQPSAAESLLPECPPATPRWALMREVELRAFRSPAVLEALLDARSPAASPAG